ncbi:fungal-specific transcription factor domain-containing protein [Mycena maculata]|uniref:Fungal-specific transcription factor domain-containing protein n=1 Tax=Mycena maculata TaxID=230809 RepID=A0AAD7HUP5_9AGAR|nr:fungal-specific transcription factor domain-containing protein [Mycena maculata]
MGRRRALRKERPHSRRSPKYFGLGESRLARKKQRSTLLTIPIWPPPACLLSTTTAAPPRVLLLPTVPCRFLSVSTSPASLVVVALYQHVTAPFLLGLLPPSPLPPATFTAPTSRSTSAPRSAVLPSSPTAFTSTRMAAKSRSTPRARAAARQRARTRTSPPRQVHVSSLFSPFAAGVADAWWPIKDGEGWHRTPRSFRAPKSGRWAQRSRRGGSWDPARDVRCRGTPFSLGVGLVLILPSTAIAVSAPTAVVVCAATAITVSAPTVLAVPHARPAVAANHTHVHPLGAPAVIRAHPAVGHVRLCAPSPSTTAPCARFNIPLRVHTPAGHARPFHHIRRAPRSNRARSMRCTSRRDVPARAACCDVAVASLSMHPPTAFALLAAVPVCIRAVRSTLVLRPGGTVAPFVNAPHFAMSPRAPAAFALLAATPRQRRGWRGERDDHVRNLTLRLASAEAALREKQELLNVSRPFALTIIRRIIIPFVPDPKDSTSLDEVADSFRALSLGGPAGFQGESSAATFLKIAAAEKPRGQTSPRHSLAPSPKTWTLKPWERLTVTPQYDFPDGNLMVSLVSLYFSHVDPFIPLLHRPQFLADVNQRLHVHDRGFASTLLLVCALGSLYLAESGASSRDQEKMGWKWFDQVELCGHSLRQQATLFDLQAYCLAAQFLLYTSNPRFCWSIIGFGLYLAQDVGAHRRRASRPITVKEELEKRVLWRLSGTLGRSTVLDPVEIHINMPSEFRDESAITLRAGFCIPTIDPTSASNVDDTLDILLSSVPKHLIWDPDHPDALSLDQSATLYCFFYHTRLLLHRPFIPAMRPRLPPLRPASRICNHAARECIRVAAAHRRRRPDNPLLFSQSPLFHAAMVLLLNLWDGSGTDEDTGEDLARIRTCIDVLKCQRDRWPSSGFFVDVLERLLSLDDCPMVKADNEADVFPGPPNPRADLDGRQTAAAIPPVFVGDEDILPGRFHRWHTVYLGLFNV